MAHFPGRLVGDVHKEYTRPVAWSPFVDPRCCSSVSEVCSECCFAPSKYVQTIIYP